MTTQEHWNQYLSRARDWTNQRFPHFAHQISSDYPLDAYVNELSVEVVDGLSIKGHEIDAMLDGLSLDVVKIHRGRISSKPEGEKVALLVHEITEGYGIEIGLYRGWGFSVIRPEHDYAEFVETHFRQENNLSRCPLELSPEDFALMEKMDEFYRKFPEWRRYIGSVLYYILYESPETPVDERLRERVLEKYTFD